MDSPQWADELLRRRCVTIPVRLVEEIRGSTAPPGGRVCLFPMQRVPHAHVFKLIRSPPVRGVVQMGIPTNLIWVAARMPTAAAVFVSKQAILDAISTVLGSLQSLEIHALVTNV